MASPSAPADLSAQFGPEDSSSYAKAISLVAAEVAARGIEADVYGYSATVQAFENDLAVLLGKEAGCFFMTGTLAQLTALRAHIAAAAGHRQEAAADASRPGAGEPETDGSAAGRLPTPRSHAHTHVVAVHPTSHIAHHDCLRNGQRQLAEFQDHASANAAGMQLVSFGSMNSAPTLTEFATMLAEHRPCAVALELPMRMCGGKTVPWEDLVKMRELATKAGVALHMDGARLWEVQPFYDRPLADICALFDTVYVSFYKGIGAMAGSMLCGRSGVVERCRELKGAHGGTPFSITTEVVHAQLMLAVQLSTFARRYERLVELVADISAIPALSGVLHFDPPVPQSCLVHGYLAGNPEQLEAAHANVIACGGARLWNRFRGCGHVPASKGVYFEWSMGPANAAIDHNLAVSSWQAFAKELLKASSSSLDMAGDQR